jgi:hypothetical protein
MRALGQKARVLPWVPLALGPVLLFGPALLKGKALFWGTPLLQFTPWRTAAKQMLIDGYLPLWNPWLGMGAPLLANYQSSLIYPPNWLLLIVDVAWGQTLLVMLHLIAAGIGMALLARRLGLNRLAQTVAGLSFGMSGYLVARAGFLSINAAAAWLPWIILAADRLTVRVRALDILALALAFSAQWLAGHAQISWYTLVLAFAWIAYRAASSAGWRAAVRGLSRLAAAGGLAFLIAGIQLLPTLEYLTVSERSAGLDPEFAMTYSFWPWRSIGLLTPDLFGNPSAGDYWGYGNYWEDAIYVGLLPLLLAASALISRRTPPIRWFLLGTALMALVLGLGRNTPIFPWLFDNVPGFALFQAPTRWNLLLIFGLSILAGYGASQWQVSTGRTLYWQRLGTAGAVAVVATAWAARAVLDDLQPTFVPAAVMAGIWMAAAGALALSRRDPPAKTWTTLAVGIVLVDLVVAGRGLNPAISSDLHTRSVELEITEHRVFMPPSVENRIKFDVAFRFDSFQPEFDWMLVRFAALPNTGIYSNIRSANNFDPILSERYVKWLETLDAATDSQQLQLLRAAEVGWVANEDGQYEAISSPARAWLVPRARWVSSVQGALNAIAAPEFDPFAEVVLEGEESSRRGGVGTVVKLEEHGPIQLEIEVDAPEGGWLVIADSWYPGWQASVDGSQAELYAANAAFRALWAPPGVHQVELVYRPRSLVVGAALSGLGLIIVILFRRR